MTYLLCDYQKQNTFRYCWWR